MNSDLGSDDDDDENESSEPKSLEVDAIPSVLGSDVRNRARAKM